MNLQSDTTPAQMPEPLRYARWLEWGTRIGSILLALSFAAYLAGWLPPHVPVRDLPALWHLPVDEFRRAAGVGLGWDWIKQLQHGDAAGLLGIALLAGCSIPCLLALLPLYLRAGDRVYVAICLAEVAVLLLAATGWPLSGR